MMSHPHNRALTDTQNVMHTFSKHFKSTKKNNRSISNCPCASGNTKNIDVQHSQKHKIKRLKSRKERSQLQGGAEGGWKSRSHHHRHHQSSKEKDNCHGCCQSNSRSPPRRDVAFTRVFPVAQEPSIITDNRLIGHHGLFNHEVKSIDIERLLSEQRKLENLGQHGGRRKNSIAPPLLTSTLLPSPRHDSDIGEFDVPNDNEEAPYKGKSERATSTTKAHKLEFRSNLESRACKCSCGDSQDDVGRKNASIQVCQEEDENLASHSNSQESGITPGQRQIHQRCLTLSESDVVMLSSTDSPSHVPATMSKESRPVVPETDRESQLSLSEENGNVRAKGQFNVLSLEQTPQIQGPLLHPHSQLGRPSPNQTESSPLASAGGSKTLGNRQSAPNPVSALAARLCKSLELPLLRGRHLVVESREVLLQALRERHGLQLQENLLMVQRHLSLATGPSTAGQGRGMVPASVDAVRPAAPFDSGFGVVSVEQLCLDPQRTATHKRRRKQLCPLRVTPPQPHSEPQQGHERTVPWSTNPSVEQVGELIGELLRPPSSSQFLMDFQPPGALSPHHIFTPPPASHWGAQAGPLQPWDGGFTMKHTSSENWRYDPDLSFLSQTEAERERNRGPFYHQRSRQPLLQYSSGPSDGHTRDFSHLTQQQNPFELGRSHFDASLFAPAHHPQDGHRLQPFYRFNHHHPTSPRSHHPLDMTYYPPSHMLEGGHSPHLTPQPALLSPEHWSFPRMRLY